MHSGSIIKPTEGRKIFPQWHATTPGIRGTPFSKSFPNREAHSTLQGSLGDPKEFVDLKAFNTFLKYHSTEKLGKRPELGDRKVLWPQNVHRGGAVQPGPSRNCIDTSAHSWTLRETLACEHLRLQFQLWQGPSSTSETIVAWGRMTTYPLHLFFFCQALFGYFFTSLKCHTKLSA